MTSGTESAESVITITDGSASSANPNPAAPCTTAPTNTTATSWATETRVSESM